MLEAVEEDAEVGLAQSDDTGLSAGQTRHPLTRGLHVEPVAAEFPKAKFVENRHAVESAIELVVRKVLDPVREVHALGVVPGVDAVDPVDAGNLVDAVADFDRGFSRELRGGLDVHGPAGDPFGEKRQHPVDVG